MKTELTKENESLKKELNDIKSGKIRLSVKSGENYVAVPKYKYEQDTKKLKAFEIIKEKRVYAWWLENCNNRAEYNVFATKEDELTQEEYDLLKEVLNNAN